jgi:hypothetical protein
MKLPKPVDPAKLDTDALLTVLKPDVVSQLMRPSVKLDAKAFKIDQNQVVIDRAALNKAITAANLKPKPGSNQAVEVEVTVKVKF